MSAVDPEVWACPTCTDTVRCSDPAVLDEVRRSHRRRHSPPRSRRGEQLVDRTAEGVQSR